MRCLPMQCQKFRTKLSADYEDQLLLRLSFLTCFTLQSG